MEFNKQSEDQKSFMGNIATAPNVSKHAGAKDGNMPLKKNKARAKSRIAKQSRRASR